MKVNWENLPTDRQPGEEEACAGFGAESYASAYTSTYCLDDLDKLSRMKYRDLVDWVRMNKHDPEYIADVLYEALAEMQPAPGSAQSGVYYDDEDWV